MAPPCAGGDRRLIFGTVVSVTSPDSSSTPRRRAGSPRSAGSAEGRPRVPPVTRPDSPKSDAATHTTGMPLSMRVTRVPSTTLVTFPVGSSAPHEDPATSANSMNGGAGTGHAVDARRSVIADAPTRRLDQGRGEGPGVAHPDPDRASPGRLQPRAPAQARTGRPRPACCHSSARRRPPPNPGQTWRNRYSTSALSRGDRLTTATFDVKGYAAHAVDLPFVRRSHGGEQHRVARLAIAGQVDP